MTDVYLNFTLENRYERKRRAEGHDDRFMKSWRIGFRKVGPDVKTAPPKRSRPVYGDRLRADAQAHGGSIAPKSKR